MAEGEQGIQVVFSTADSLMGVEIEVLSAPFVRAVDMCLHCCGLEGRGKGVSATAATVATAATAGMVGGHVFTLTPLPTM